MHSPRDGEEESRPRALPSKTSCRAARHTLLRPEVLLARVELLLEPLVALGGDLLVRVVLLAQLQEGRARKGGENVSLYE